MNADIRLSVEFLDHPKTVKLQRRLGLEAVFCLLRLWTWAAQNRSEGTLNSMDAECIEIAARWSGEIGVFVETLVALAFLDECNGVYSLHNWHIHQEYVANERKRIAKSQKAALARWGTDKELREVKSGISKTDNGLCSSDASSNATGNAKPMPQDTSGNGPIRSDPEEEKTGGVGYCARTHEASLVPENTEPDASSPEEFQRPDGPKKTDSPSKGHPQWAAFQPCFAAYPVPQGKEEAWREWMRQWKNGTLPEPYVIRDAILLHIAEDTWWQRGKAPKMAKWLYNRGWEDQPYIEPAVVPRASPGIPRPLTAAQEKRELMAMNSQDVLNAREVLRHDPQNPYRNGIGGDVCALPPAEAR